MSRLARRVATVTVIVLGLQFVVTAGLQLAMARTFRAAMVTQLYRDMEGSGLLDDCATRPGPWTPQDSGRAAWPVSPDGLLVGDDVPVQQVLLPEPGHTTSLYADGVFGEVYASSSPGCGGIVHVVRGANPAFEFFSMRLAALGTLRFLLTVLVGITLVALTAVPLVRRIRALADAMNRIVNAKFEGQIDDRSQDELGDVGRAFSAAAQSVRAQLQRLEHRDTVLRHALADFAHDLRTPLTTLQLSVSSISPPESSARIRRELSYLQGLMQNFEAVLVGEEEGELDAVPLNHLVERVQHRFAPIAKDRNLTFDVALPDDALYAKADATAVERAVSNLVHNALRFADAHVVLLLFADEGEVRVEVRDDGPGFGPGLERAAERGTRGSDSAEVGFGLGLAIAEASARRFGGRLELSNADARWTLAALVMPSTIAP